MDSWFISFIAIRLLSKGLMVSRQSSFGLLADPGEEIVTCE
jgi:hypothetical protein